jgi:hypothetical protein
MDDSGNNHIYLALIDAEKKIANDHTTIKMHRKSDASRQASKVLMLPWCVMNELQFYESQWKVIRDACNQKTDTPKLQEFRLADARV